MRWRWQHETVPGDPWTNMALDTDMLTALMDGRAQTPALRIYEWDRPSVSIGRLQKEDAVRRKYPDLPWVRRPTGGRAVLHGGDLTITVATRAEWLPGTEGQGILPTYRLIMAGLRDALRHCGVPTAFGSPRSPQQASGVIDCFDFAAGCDLVDSRTGRKIAGCAQRREQSAILQQTSLLLEGLPNLETFVPQLQAGFQSALRVDEWVVN